MGSGRNVDSLHDHGDALHDHQSGQFLHKHGTRTLHDHEGGNLFRVRRDGSLGRTDRSVRSGSLARTDRSVSDGSFARTDRSVRGGLNVDSLHDHGNVLHDHQSGAFLHKHGDRRLHDHDTGDFFRVRRDGNLRLLRDADLGDFHDDHHFDRHHHRRRFVHIGLGLAGYPFYYPYYYPYYGFSYGLGYAGYPYAWPVYAYDPLCPYPVLDAYGAAPAEPYGAPEDASAVAPPGEAPEQAAADVPRAEEYAREGEAAFRAGDYEEAVRAWRHALLEEPRNGVLILMLAQALFEISAYEEAAGAVQQGMLVLQEENWGVVVGNYTELYGDTQDYVDQLKDLEKAVREKSDLAALRFLVGYHYGFLGYPAEAVRELDKLLELASGDQLGRKLRELMAAKIQKPAEQDSSVEKNDNSSSR